MVQGGPPAAPIMCQSCASFSDVPMEDVSDLSEADKNSLTDESDDSGIIPGSHSESELRVGEDLDDITKSQG